jgi:hypothetical protein
MERKKAVSGVTLLDTQQPARFLSLKAFFWNPGGGRTVRLARYLKLKFRIEFPEEGCVEQEADGGWIPRMDAGAVYDSFLKACGHRAIQPGVWPEPGPGAIGGLDQAEFIPGDKFFEWAAGSKPGAVKG